MDQDIYKEVNDCKPQVIDHFIGQGQVVNKVKVALEASWNSGTKLPHILCQGAPVWAKTELCHILAKEMGSELHEQLAQNITCPADLHALLLQPKDRDVVLLDEIHELPPLAQTTLYRAMENRQIFLETKRGKKSRELDISNFTIIGATTDSFRLLKPLRDRFKITLDFQHYDENDLELLVKNRARQLGWLVEEEVFEMIATRGKGTPRIALRLLESARLTASADNSSVITVKHFKRTCQLEDIDEIGLSANERNYLNILYENNGSARLNIIATRLAMHSRTVSALIEDHLIRTGLVTKSNSKRVLTAEGIEYVKNNFR